MFKKIFILLSLTLFFVFVPRLIFAKTIDEEISEISKQIADLEKAIAPLKSESGDLSVKIKNANNQIYLTQKNIDDLGQKLIDKETDLEVQKILMGERIKTYYKNSKRYSPLTLFFGDSDNDNLVLQYSWYQSIINRDKDLISQYGQEINTLATNKKNLEIEKVKLATLQQDLKDRFGFLAGEIKKAEDYKAELSKKQQDLIAAKTAMFNTSVGDVSSSQDPASRADYNPGFSPAFALFSFGAPHRKGMSQFGAFGRAKQGQNYETILKAYYGDIRLENTDTSGSISTSVGTIPFEDNYLLGIAEMPTSWGSDGGMEALKAQAIAARTYALAYTNNRSRSICTTEACQVYSSSKASSPGVWRDAVTATKGIVIKSNKTGSIFSTMYASTSGGAIYSYTSADHSTPMVWDTSCGSQSCWPNDSFEKVSASPWYYKGWYMTRSGADCGRSHPWLTQKEFSDIINAVLYYSKTDDYSHLSQYDSGGCFGGNDPNAWSIDELARQVESHGGPVSSVNSVTVDYSTGGYTQTVRVSTNKGDFNFTGDEFKTVFNLRAPGAIVVKSSLFNIEKK